MRPPTLALEVRAGFRSLRRALRDGLEAGAGAIDAAMTFT
jgi:hypothetical protein